MKKPYHKSYFALAVCLIFSLQFRAEAQNSRISNTNFKRPGGVQQSNTSPTKKKTAPISTFAAPSAAPGIVDQNDIAVFPSGNDQSEIHISINRQNPNILVLSCNTYVSNYNQGRYVSTDGGATWSGADILNANVSQVSGDPSTAIDASDNIYISTITGADNGYFVTKSVDNGNTFSSLTQGVTVAGFDKEMIAADDNLSSPYANNLYAAWTTFGSSETVNFNRSTDGANTFSSSIILKNGPGQGTNIQVGPNGEVYVCYADYGSSGALPASGLGFVKSLDGGSTFSAAQVPVGYTGIRSSNGGDPLFNNIRVNDFPSMAVDKTGGAHNGRIYVTFAAKQNGSGKAVIELTYSDDQGSTWSPPQEISISAGLQSFFPWITVDQATGSVYVAYFCIDGSSFQTNTYCAISNDGANSFINQLVSDVSHTTQPINNSRYSAGYEGDYIGVAAYGGKAYVAWMDERTGAWQAYVSRVDNTNVPNIAGPPYVCNSSIYSVNNLPSGATVAWSIPGSAGPVLQLAQNTPSTNQLTITNQHFYSISTTLTATITNGGVTSNITLPIANDNATSGNGYAYTQDACTYYNVPHPAQSGTINGATYVHMGCDVRVTLNLPSNKTVTLASGSGTPIYWYYSGGILYFALPIGSGGIPFTFNIGPKNNDGSCTSSILFFAYSNNGNATYAYTVAPNPVNSTLNIVASSSSTTPENLKGGTSTTSSKASQNNLQFTAKIYDIIYNRFILSQKSNRGELFQNIDVSSLRAGNYAVIIDDGTQTVSLKFIKN
ncbi:MAG TPA: T9SS type A sorting domain-containing protein [Mucilaginibacter sp.]|jgi:hypothetical protein|nr:T9SS type A sorting domain-containing protein [Mucilaginibacter sp.]